MAYACKGAWFFMLFIRRIDPDGMVGLLRE